MGEEKNPLADKVLKNGKSIEESKQESTSNGQFEIQMPINTSNNSVFSNGNGYKQANNQYDDSKMNMMNGGILKDKFEVPKPKYPQKNMKCDMEIEILD